MDQYKEKTMKLQPRRMVNFTQQSFIKFDGVKIQNLIYHLQKNDLPYSIYAHNIQAYFRDHTRRKQNRIDQLRDKIIQERNRQRQIMQRERQESKYPLMDQMHGVSQDDIIQSQNPLMILFLEHLNLLKRQIIERKTLTQLQNVKSTKIRPN